MESLPFISKIPCPALVPLKRDRNLQIKMVVFRIYTKQPFALSSNERNVTLYLILIRACLVVVLQFQVRMLCSEPACALLHFGKGDMDES